MTDLEDKGSESPEKPDARAAGARMKPRLSLDPSSPISPPRPKGIPDGWSAYEKTELKSGKWRFFHIVDQELRSSIREDNWVLKGTKGKNELKGLTDFIKDHKLHKNPEAIPPETFAAQVGMFLIRGHSRRSCSFEVLTDLAEYPQHAEKLHLAETRVEDGTLIHRAWLKRNGGRNLQHFVVKVPRRGKAQADFEEWLVA